VSAGISHNIAQERQVDSLHGEREVILAYRIGSQRLTCLHCMHALRERTLVGDDGIEPPTAPV
jgi:hypothetical protein